mmetsp:Transcript_43118/g.119262  ORF Transcript_43118/g.119262 Transcript_43118/m.119262 type:complete len:204 (+) Transcript_43118:215-826(+)
MICSCSVDILHGIFCACLLESTRKIGVYGARVQCQAAYSVLPQLQGHTAHELVQSGFTPPVCIPTTSGVITDRPHTCTVEYSFRSGCSTRLLLLACRRIRNATVGARILGCRVKLCSVAQKRRKAFHSNKWAQSIDCKRGSHRLRVDARQTPFWNEAPIFVLKNSRRIQEEIHHRASTNWMDCEWMLCHLLRRSRYRTGVGCI